MKELKYVKEMNEVKEVKVPFSIVLIYFAKKCRSYNLVYEWIIKPQTWKLDVAV